MIINLFNFSKTSTKFNIEISDPERITATMRPTNCSASRMRRRGETVFQKLHVIFLSHCTRKAADVLVHLPGPKFSQYLRTGTWTRGTDQIDRLPKRWPPRGSRIKTTRTLTNSGEREAAHECYDEQGLDELSVHVGCGARVTGDEAKTESRSRDEPNTREVV